MKTKTAGLLHVPHTKSGWWAAGLLGLFIVLFLINSFVFIPSTENALWRHALLPFYGIFMLLCGLAAGIAGVVSVIRAEERSWLAWMAILPALFVLFLLTGEFLFPH